MPLSLEQVAEMAPDTSSAAAGKKLMAIESWEDLGQNPEAVWGLCRGSATYQVKVDLGNLGYHCSCPSRKFPCKHVLGLLMLFAASPDAVASCEPPGWVGEWLERRRSRQQKEAERETAEAKKPVDEAAQQRRAEQREAKVSEGLVRLEIWLKDLVRNGLAAVESKPPAFWEDQARRLVDAQAPGLASRVARLSLVPRSSRDWPARLLGEIGRIELLIHAWQRAESIDPILRQEIRQFLGWNVSQPELERDGEQVGDSWVAVGQWVDDEGRIRTQRSWLVGRETGRAALVLQFSAGGQPFPESIVPGGEQRATLVYYPGAVPQRAKFVNRTGAVESVTTRFPGAATIGEFLAGVAQQLARQPWLAAFGAVLHDVRVVPQAEAWRVVDLRGNSIPLSGRAHWRLLALSGGQPFDMTGEWDGHVLRPLGMYLDNTFRIA
ncbi:MAG: SWIM zinc finger domain-containing protein [Thermoguttaceae bacterium]|nr:SWIM zinc finger domain-containing protein [Thermoguttaceae bacterium]